MANSKTENMIRGLGMGMAALDLLIKAIEKQGGSAEMLQFMTRPRFSDNLVYIAQAFVDCDWRIPASEMRDLAESSYRREFEADESKLEEVRNLWWGPVVRHLGFPIVEYSNDEAEGVPAIPSWIKKQLDGRKMAYPLYIEDYVVVEITADSKGEIPPVGEIIRTDQIEYLSLTERRYFNFDK